MKLFRIRTVEYWPENFRRGARYFVGDGVMIWPVSETRYHRAVRALRRRQEKEASLREAFIGHAPIEKAMMVDGMPLATDLSPSRTEPPPS